VQAAIMGASKGIPYEVLRQTMVLGKEKRNELTSAAQAVAAKYPAFFAEHKDLVEFVTVLMAFKAAQMDHLLSLLGQSDASPAPAEPGPPKDHVCSAREALAIALIILAPLGLLARALTTFEAHGWLSPPAWAFLAGYYPVRAAYTYIKRLWSWKLLERRLDRRGLLLYRISERGQARLAWLRQNGELKG
jgi:hypothetical protein